MKIYKVGKVDNMRSITVFHAMARLNLTGLVITEPKDTYVSVGYFDRVEDIIDYEKCKRLGIPVMRREIGGGAVLLAPGQVFYQLIIPRRLAPFKVEDAYRKFSKPVIEVYRRLGLDVEYRPINDLVLKKGKKISGQGAADIEKCFVFVGNILLRFDTKLMSELFRVSHESFRKRLFKSLEENISWVERESRRGFSYEEIEGMLIEEFSKVIDFEGFGDLTEDIVNLADRLKDEFTSTLVLFEDTGRKHHFLKIREGVYVRDGERETAWGLLRSEVFVREGRIVSMKITGNISQGQRSFLGKLEDALKGADLSSVKRIVESFLEKEGVDGISQEDISSLIVGKVD